MDEEQEAVATMALELIFTCAILAGGQINDRELVETRAENIAQRFINRHHDILSKLISKKQ